MTYIYTLNLNNINTVKNDVQNNDGHGLININLTLLGQTYKLTMTLTYLWHHNERFISEG